MNTPLECRAIANELEQLERRASNLEDRISDATPSMKAGLIARAAALGKQAAAKSAELQSCLRNAGTDFGMPTTMDPDTEDEVPIVIPQPCEALAAKVRSLTARANRYADRLSQTTGSVKADIVRRILALNAEIISTQKELDRCLIGQGIATRLVTTFNCTATLTTTDDRAPGPYSQSGVKAEVVFNAARTTVQILSLTPVKTTFDTPIGSNTTTVTLKGIPVGRFTLASGHIVIKTPLLFDNSIDILFLVEDSDMDNLFLGTMQAPGSPVDRGTGDLTLAGRGTFTGGILDGARGTLILAGKLEDIP